MCSADLKQDNREMVWKYPIWIWVILVTILSILGFIYFDGLDRMVNNWIEREEYSHGLLILPISLFLIWQKKDRLERMKFDGSWYGVLIIVVASVLYVVAEISAITILAQYAFFITLFGIAYTLVGMKGMKEIWVPFLLLFFTIPLPALIFQQLSQSLQLISSEIGVVVIRLFDISVFLEGNVIDLGTMKLQVVEACSGLRYLFPLMTLGFIAAYFFKDAIWKKILIFLSTIPITVLMNSFRIGMIGILVEYWGPSMAEGFLHDFEGWFIFMACTLILVFEMWILSRIGISKRPLQEIFGLEFPEPTPNDSEVRVRQIPKPYLSTIVFSIVLIVISINLIERKDIYPTRESFANFPLQINNWTGNISKIDQITLERLDLDDYIIANYNDGNENIVNLYAAYYLDQRKGEAIHSPRACIPGGGWRINSLTEYAVNDVVISQKPLKVNRLIIQLNETRQLVYYWFQQRGRVITDEYLLKWYLFVDSLKMNRSDGALVRLTTILRPGEDMKDADRRLTVFAKEINPYLAEYIPE